MEVKKKIIEEGKNLIKSTDAGKKILNQGKKAVKASGAKKVLKEGQKLMESTNGKELLDQGKKIVKAVGGKKLMKKGSKKVAKAVEGGKKLLQEGNDIVNGSSRKRIVKALVAGVALGATIGVMIAPDTGAKTRKKVGKAAKAVKDKVQTYAEDIQSVGKAVKTKLT